MVLGDRNGRNQEIHINGHFSEVVDLFKYLSVVFKKKNVCNR